MVFDEEFVMVILFLPPTNLVVKVMFFSHVCLSTIQGLDPSRPVQDILSVYGPGLSPPSVHYPSPTSVHGPGLSPPLVYCGS